MSQYSSITSLCLKCIVDGSFTNDCIFADDGDTVMASCQILLSISELIDATITSHYDVHAVSKIALVHHYKKIRLGIYAELT